MNQQDPEQIQTNEEDVKEPPEKEPEEKPDEKSPEVTE